MSKTPYEIRLELLKMAQDQLTQRYYTDLNVKQQNSQLKNEPLTEVPAFPTSQEILKEAETLKGFVDKA
jgi:hypothetical protein